MDAWHLCSTYSAPFQTIHNGIAAKAAPIAIPSAAVAMAMTPRETIADVAAFGTIVTASGAACGEGDCNGSGCHRHNGDDDDDNDGSDGGGEAPLCTNL
jgi:hypothetical protein